MKLIDIAAGDLVTVTRGYSRRPAIVTKVTAPDRVHRGGRVYVTFTDAMIAPDGSPIDPITTIPQASRSYLFGADVLPRQITPR